MNSKKSTIDPIFNLGSIVFLICAVILTVVKPDWVGAWIDAPAWFGGFFVFYLVMAGLSLRTYAKVSMILEDIEKREVMAHEND